MVLWSQRQSPINQSILVTQHGTWSGKFWLPPISVFGCYLSLIPYHVHFHQLGLHSLSPCLVLYSKQWGKETFCCQQLASLTIDLSNMTTTTDTDSNVNPSKPLFPQQQYWLLDLCQRISKVMLRTQHFNAQSTLQTTLENSTKPAA